MFFSIIGFICISIYDTNFILYSANILAMHGPMNVKFILCISIPFSEKGSVGFARPRGGGGPWHNNG